MADTAVARPVGPDDQDEDCFAFLTNVTHTYGHPDRDIEVMHAEFFECHSDEARRPDFGQTPHRCLAVTKNVYNLTPIFRHGPRLVVTTFIRDALASCCTVEFREVRIEKAFWLPYGPGDRSFELAGVALNDRPKEVIPRFAAMYGCPAPDEKFYEVIVHSGYRIGPHYPDTRTLVLGDDAPEGLSVYPREAEVSRRMIEEHGLVFDRGYLCRPDVYDLLNPYLHRPWFWTQKYAYLGRK